MTKEVSSNECVTQSGSAAIIFHMEIVDAGIEELIHRKDVEEMASAIMDLGFDCNGYTDEELADVYLEIVGD